MTTSSPLRVKTPIPPLLKVRDVARLLTVSRQTVYALVDSGELEGRALNPRRRKLKRSHVRITSRSLAKFYHERVGHDLDLTLLQP